MKSTSDLLNTSEKINQIISEDLKLVKSFETYLIRRQELEQSFADEMSVFLNAGNRNNSACSALIYDEMFAVFAHHKDLAKDISETFIPPVTSFLNYLDREQKNMDNSIQKASDSIRAYEKKLFVARSHVERAQLDVLHFSSTKADRSKRNVKNYEKELDNIEKEQESHIKNLREVEFPNLFQQTADLDFCVRTTVKNSMLNLMHLEITSQERLIESLHTVNSSTARYEPSNETAIIAKSLGMASSKHKLFAIVRCSFEGYDVNDLPLSRGELIEVTRQHPSGWWEGECNGRRGLFPMTFVEMITDVESGALTINECFEVDGPYIPIKPDEIMIDFGDVVFVSTLKDGWCEGYKLGSNEHGRFPANVIKHIKQMRQWMHQEDQ